MLSRLNIEKAAIEYREKCGYKDINPIRIKSLLQQLNVLTVFKSMENTFSGMSLKVDQNRFMLINSAHSIGRQHFTIFHELHHLYIEKDFEQSFCEEITENRNKTSENEADLFAANLLLPRDGLLKLIPPEQLKRDNIQLSTILAIEQYYSCSHKAMLVRLLDLNLISKQLKDKYDIDILAEAKKYGYDTTLYKPGNNNLVIGDYGVKARELFDNEIISRAHYLELMRDLGITFGDSKKINEN